MTIQIFNCKSKATKSGGQLQMLHSLESSLKILLSFKTDQLSIFWVYKLQKGSVKI